MTNKSDIFSHFDAISLRRFFLVFFFFFNLKAFCNSIMNRHQKFNTLNSVQFLFNVFLMMCYVLTYSSFDFHFLLLLSGWADFKEFIGKKAPSTERGRGRRPPLAPEDLHYQVVAVFTIEHADYWAISKV